MNVENEDKHNSISIERVLGLITKGVGKYINQILGSVNVEMVLKIVLLRSSNILRTTVSIT